MIFEGEKEMTDEGSKHERWSTISFYFYNRCVYVAENCSVSCYLPLHPPPLFFPVELATLYEIKFYLFIKNFGLLSLRIFFGIESPFFSISSRVYEVNPDIFCFPLRGFPCRASFLPRFKTVSITIRTAINNKQCRRAP